MDETAETVQNSGDDTQIFMFLAIGGTLILVLLIVVFLQSRRIKELSRPKFGFLGKPLSFLALALMIGSGVGLTYYVRSGNESDVQQINADIELKLQIEYEVIDASQNVYRFHAIPFIDNVMWGNEDIEYNVNWQIENSKKTTQFEYNLSRLNSGGIIIQLEPGKNTIKSSIFLQQGEITETIVVEI